MPYHHELLSDDAPLTAGEHKGYRSILGSLSWFTTIRYDIAYEVNRLAQYLVNPTRGCRKALNRVMAYLAGTWDKKLQVCRVKGDVWTRYSDSDHAGDRTTGDSRSRTGVMLLLNGMPVHWRSNKQPVTSLSSAAAEIYALSEACKDAKLMAWIAEEMGQRVRWPMSVMVDNAAGVSFQQGTTTNSRLKGIFDMRQKWVLEMRDKKLIKADKVETAKNVADLFTKSLNAIVRAKLENEIAGLANAAVARAI
jgi:hypothetical protein